jgi:hypothetical protein
MRIFRYIAAVAVFVLLISSAQRGLAADVCLFDEESGFAENLFRSSGASTAVVTEGDAFSGKKFLRVTPESRGCEFFFTPTFVWDYTVAEKPVPGEYRYILFAWRKTGGQTIQLGFSDDRSGTLLTYCAGTKTGYRTVGKRRYVQVADSVPGEWQYVIRDMYADLQGFQFDFMINGISFVAGDGTSADFDCIYLSDDRAALEKLAGQLKKGAVK